ncbi:MAG: hypothetical protein LBB65_01885 [Burkholderiales bacterium]|nr:hypothetical protein [Burkholderiales bacterium]
MNYLQSKEAGKEKSTKKSSLWKWLQTSVCFFSSSETTGEDRPGRATNKVAVRQRLVAANHQALARETLF